MADVLVLADVAGDVGAKPALELLTLAARLGDPVVVVAGEPSSVAAAKLGEYGARAIVAVRGDAVGTTVGAGLVAALESLVRARSPIAVLLTSSAEGKEVAGRLAVRIDSGVLTDAVDVVSADGSVVVEQSVFGGSTVVHARVTRGTPIVTVRPNSVTPEATGGGAPAVETVDVVLDAGAPRAATVTQRSAASSGGRPGLTEASVVVAGGRGVGAAEKFALIEELADVLSAAVGASRAATDAGWYPHAAQVGQTGVTVAPQLYIACGISGAIQHRAGMQTAKTIVAINKDAEAPIFELADFGVVGDLHTVVPQLIEEIRKRKS
jgi:electron transfer flavoprotein alpha subunit